MRAHVLGLYANSCSAGFFGKSAVAGVGNEKRFGISWRGAGCRWRLWLLAEFWRRRDKWLVRVGALLYSSTFTEDGLTNKTQIQL